MEFDNMVDLDCHASQYWEKNEKQSPPGPGPVPNTAPETALWIT